MSYWLGIDVGTTFTAAAVCREQAGRRALPEVVPLGTRSTAVSSVVYLGPDGQVVVGDAAERRAHTDPERVVREFKRRIGDEVPMVVGGVAHTAPQIAAMVVGWVVERVVQREGGPAAGIVVTHPAGWGPYKTQTMAEALRATGLPEITFRTEPEAAAASYALAERVDIGSTIAVYDLGGGTFDAAVVRKTGPHSFRVLGQPQGLDHLGGVDFDDVVFGHVLAAVPALRELDPDDPATLAATSALRRECTEAKEALSADTEVTIPVLTGQTRTQVRLVRAEFEDLIRPQITDTLHVLHQALRCAKLTAQDLDAILLVGGSSRIPLVAQLVSAEFGRPLAVDADPKTAIASGAALSALPPTVDPTATGPAADAPAPDGNPHTPTHEPGPPVVTQPEEPPRPSLTAIPLDVEPAELQWRRARKRRVKQLTLAGALALFTVAGVASVPFLTAHSGPVPPAAAGTAAPETPPAPDAANPAANAPVANAPAAQPGSNNGGSLSGRSGGGVRTTPPAAPNKLNKPAGDAPAPLSTSPQPTWITTYTWTSTWTTTPTHTPPPQPTTTPPTAPATTATTKGSPDSPPRITTTTAPPPTASSSPHQRPPG